MDEEKDQINGMIKVIVRVRPELQTDLALQKVKQNGSIKILSDTVIRIDREGRNQEPKMLSYDKVFSGETSQE